LARKDTPFVGGVGLRDGRQLWVGCISATRDPLVSGKSRGLCSPQVAGPWGLVDPVLPRRKRRALAWDAKIKVYRPAKRSVGRPEANRGYRGGGAPRTRP